MALPASTDQAIRKWGTLKSNMNEKWKIIKNCVNYAISNKGRIKNISTGKLLKPSIDRYGYLKISISDYRGIKRYFTIHRLVASAWIYVSDKTLQVNHKNGIKTDNTVDNLEWVSVKRNIQHSFEMLLNDNANPVIIYDIDRDSRRRIRSVKEAARLLSMKTSVLVPLIRFSAINPIYNRFILQLENEKSLFTTFNSKHFGLPIYCFDQISMQVAKYPSVLAASYFTGIRSLSKAISVNRDIEILGFEFSTQENLLPKKTIFDKEAIAIERLKYRTAAYCPRNYRYALFDYFRKVEIEFSDLKGIEHFINSQNLMQVTTASIAEALGEGVKRNKTGLIRGYGIRSEKNAYAWFPYTEEIILRNKFLKRTYRAYRVYMDGIVRIIFGLEGLCKKFTHLMDERFPWKEDLVLQLLNSKSGIVVERLNKPLI